MARRPRRLSGAWCRSAMALPSPHCYFPDLSFSAKPWRAPERSDAPPVALPDRLQVRGYRAAKQSETVAPKEVVEGKRLMLTPDPASLESRSAYGRAEGYSGRHHQSMRAHHDRHLVIKICA